MDGPWSLRPATGMSTLLLKFMRRSMIKFSKGQQAATRHQPVQATSLVARDCRELSDERNPASLGGPTGA